MTDTMLRQLATIFAIICVVVQLVAGSDASSDVQSSLLQPSYVVSLVSMSSIVCVIVVIVACTKWCPRDVVEYKDFDNPGFFENVEIGEPPAIGMIPPNVDSITFEALPDVREIQRHQLPMMTNTPLNINESQLRPKIAQIGHDRVDSDDEGDVVTREALLLQERVKLEKLLSNTQHRFDRHQLQYLRELGNGWFGKVLLADGQDVLPGHKKSRVVVQTLHENADQHTQYLFLQEAAPYRDMDHANVLKIIGHCVDVSHPFLTVLERCTHGDVKTYLRNHRTDHDSIDKQGLLLNIACDMASGLQALHQSNFVHRDFALRNCLLTSDMAVKVGDYGLAEEIYKDDYFTDSSNNAVPIRWLAPEVVEPTNGSVMLRHITKDCNLWSFGVALWELVTFGGLPYTELTNEQVIQQVISDGSVRLCQPEVPGSNLNQLYQLMSLCWLAPAQRRSLKKLRMMLGDLRSSRDELEASEFDRRWNRMMPRISATLPSVITDTNDDEEAEMGDFSLAPPALSKHGPTDVQTSVLPMVHSLPGSGIPAIVRPASFDSEFSSELNASLAAQAGSRQTSLRSLSTSPGNTPDDLTLDDSFTAMTPAFAFISNEQSLTATDLKASTNSSSAFEMVSYGKSGEAKVVESEDSIKADVNVNASSNIPEIMPVSAHTSTPPTEHAVDKETAKDNFDSGEEDWQCFGDLSTNQNVSNSSISAADESSVVMGKTDGDKVSADVSSDAGGSNNLEESEQTFSAVENGPDSESDVGKKEHPDSKEGSFCMLKVSVGEDESPTKSLDIDSPVKSTTSSADWCLLSNHTEHSREEELDAVSHVTDPSLPSDCVFVASDKVASSESLPEEMSNADVGSGDVQESVSECSVMISKDATNDVAEH